MDYTNAAKSQVIGGSILGQPMEAQRTKDPERFFSDARNTIDIGGEAANAAITSLQLLMRRLGIHSMYGCADESASPEPAGEIEGTQQRLYGLVDMIREIRGLAETIEARL